MDKWEVGKTEVLGVGPYVVYCGAEVICTTREEQHAVLIASAPALLELCKEAHKVINRPIGMHGPLGFDKLEKSLSLIISRIEAANG